MARVILNESILLVEDDGDLAEVMQGSLQDAGYQVVRACHGEEALFCLERNRIFLILSDYAMPVMDGMQLLQHVRAAYPHIPFIMITGYSDSENEVAALRQGVADFLRKPMDHQKLLDAVQAFAQKRQDFLQKEREESLMIRQTFIEEAREILQRVDESLLRIEANPSDTGELNDLFRRVHTMKGSSGAVQEAAFLTPVAHAFETVLSALKDRRLNLSASITNTMLDGADILRKGIEALEHDTERPDTQGILNRLSQVASFPGDQRDQGTGKPLPLVEEKRDDGDEGVLVSNDKLDQFMEVAGELVAFKNIFYGFVRQHPEYAGLDDMNKELSKLTDFLQAKIMDIRKVSLHKAFGKFPRMVRGIAQELKKSVNYETDGLNLQVDKSIAKALSNALVHVVRNACDHGIEGEAERVQNGKDAKGRIRISASESGDVITVVVQDDGRGLNRDRIHAKAASQGLIHRGLASMSDEEVFGLIFLPGFSTAETVTDLSGRGVGMDVVRTAVKAMGGSIRLHSRPNEGTRLTIQIPVPKSIMVEQSIVVESAGLLLAIPLTSIGEILSVKDIELTYLQPFWVMMREHGPVPVATFQQLVRPETIASTQVSEQDPHLAVVVTHNNRSLALRVDAVLDQIEAVVRPFDRLTQSIPGFKGTCLLPGDRLGYMVSSENLLKMTTDSSQNPVPLTQAA